MKIPSWDFGQIPKGLEWRHKNREKTTIPGHFLGIFEIFGGGKGTPRSQIWKIYLLNILPPQQSKQLCLEEVFPSFSPFGR
jgi:hypothetical protein